MSSQCRFAWCFNFRQFGQNCSSNFALFMNNRGKFRSSAFSSSFFWDIFYEYHFTYNWPENHLNIRSSYLEWIQAYLHKSVIKLLVGFQDLYGHGQNYQSSAWLKKRPIDFLYVNVSHKWAILWALSSQKKPFSLYSTDPSSLY